MGPAGLSSRRDHTIPLRESVTENRPSETVTAR
jgi:hypothetical protein